MPASGISPHLSVNIPDVCIVECSDGSGLDCTWWSLEIFAQYHSSCHVNERMKPNDNINAQKWHHLSLLSLGPGLMSGRKILNNHFSVIILSFFSVMLINNQYKDKLSRLKGEEQIDNEHYAVWWRERDQVQIMIKVSVIESKQVTIEQGLVSSSLSWCRR